METAKNIYIYINCQSVSQSMTGFQAASKHQPHHQHHHPQHSNNLSFIPYKSYAFCRPNLKKVITQNSNNSHSTSSSYTYLLLIQLAASTNTHTYLYPFWFYLFYNRHIITIYIQQSNQPAIKPVSQHPGTTNTTTSSLSSSFVWQLIRLIGI